MLPISRIGQGTWGSERGDRATVVAALQQGLELGLSHIDTAEMYGGGEVERIVGEALRGRRERAFVASKVLPHNASRSGTVAACEESLRRLGTDRLDLYLLHWPGEHPLVDTIAAFEELVGAGKIVRYGVSNFDAHELAEAVRIAGPGKIACNQVLYHLEERAVEHAVLPLCRELGVAMVGYSPFASGSFLSARPGGREALAEVAARHRTGLRQVALAFLLRDPVAFTIPKAGSIEHVRANATAAELVLAPEDVAALERAFPRGRRRGPLPMI